MQSNACKQRNTSAHKNAAQVNMSERKARQHMKNSRRESKAIEPGKDTQQAWKATLYRKRASQESITTQSNKKDWHKMNARNARTQIKQASYSRHVTEQSNTITGYANARASCEEAEHENKSRAQIITPCNSTQRHSTSNTVMHA